MWKYNPNATKQQRTYRTHWFERDGHRSICGRVINSEDWIEDIAGGYQDCERCQFQLEKTYDGSSDLD